jgi:hypothetical protein
VPGWRLREIQTSRLATLLAGALIGGYFLYQARRSLRAEFTHNDLMNCWRAVFDPLAVHLRDCVLFFRHSDSYRPFPALVYRAAFHFSGFDLLPLRVLLLLIMGVNIFLTFSFARRLADSREAGLLAALLGCYHGYLTFLYFDTGFLYDIFCFFFYFGALVFYLRIRQSGRLLRWRETLIFCTLYVLALDSKELGVSLPAVIAVWELLFHRPLLRAGALVRWQYRELLPSWISGGIAAAFVFGRVLGRDSLSQTGGYAISLSPAVYLKNTGHVLNELFYAHGFFTESRTLWLLGMLLVVALLARSRALIVCWILYFVGVLPIAFLSGRGLAAAWVPAVGLVIYAAVLIVLLRDSALARLGTVRWRPALQALTFVAVFWLVVRVHPPSRAFLYSWQTGEYPTISSVRESFIKLCPSMKPKSTVLIVTDPLNGTFSTVFLIHLLYRDSSIIVNQLFRFEKPLARARWAGYDYIFDVKDGKLIRLNPADYAR